MYWTGIDNRNRGCLGDQLLKNIFHPNIEITVYYMTTYNTLPACMSLLNNCTTFIIVFVNIIIIIQKL